MSEEIIILNFHFVQIGPIPYKCRERSRKRRRSYRIWFGYASIFALNFWPHNVMPGVRFMRYHIVLFFGKTWQLSLITETSEFWQEIYIQRKRTQVVEKLFSNTKFADGKVPQMHFTIHYSKQLWFGIVSNAKKIPSADISRIELLAVGFNPSGWFLKIRLASRTSKAVIWMSSVLLRKWASCLPRSKNVETF